jgi:hypothetical protein
MATPQIAPQPTAARRTAGLSCPGCGSPNVSRSQRVDWQEKLECWIRRVLPYRCRKCDLRFLARKSSD